MKKLTTIILAVIYTVNLMAQVPSYVPTNGLVGWWPFTGNANDSSGNGNNGTVLNANLSLDRFGNLNSCYMVDGIDCPSAKGVSLPVNLSNALEYTIHIWYFTNDSAKFNQTIINSSPHQYIGVSYNYVGWGNVTSGGIGNGVWLNAGPTGTIQWNTYNMSSWHSLTLSKELTQFKFYGDGVLKFTHTITSTFNSGLINNIIVGASSINGGVNCYEVFKGKLDDIGIWNRALTQQEITALYTGGCVKSLAITPSINAKTIGSNATFTATTTASNPSYIWQSNFGQGFQTLNNVGQYSGTSTNAMSISNVQLSNHMEPIRAISTSGTCKDTSNIAYVKILDTCITKINDTVKITKYDTVKVTRYDTIKITKYDTIKVTDTLVINATLSGVSAPNNTNRLLIYPNPAKDHITIDYGVFGRMSGYTLKIVNTLGQIVFSTPINQQTSYINLSTWTGKGMYYVQIYDASNTMTENRKIVLQ